MEELYHTEKISLERIASGDRKAFNELYTAHIEGVYNYIYLFTKSKDETEEILQGVFVSIWESREKLEAIRSFKHYLSRASKNKLINHIRHIKIKNRVLAERGQRVGRKEGKVSVFKSDPYCRATLHQYQPGKAW
ncbi:MAG TPA: sigma factor [Chitinophagaceae bacterium]|nr:sigma factor [Chitinophagaceae bacterium]